MSSLPRIRDINRIQECSAEKFDEEFLRTVKGQGFTTGFFFYPDGPIKRYLLIDNGQPFAAAWDDGLDGGGTRLLEFFDPFLKSNQDLTFCQTDNVLINAMGVSWQQRPDAHTSPGLIDAAEMIKSLLRRNREFIVRLRRDAQTSFLTINAGKIIGYYFDTKKHVEGEAETKLVHELTANHAFLSIDVFENQDAAKADDWAITPADFDEGMIKFYCCSSPHLVLSIGDRELQRLPLNGDLKITIGRDPQNEMVIDNLSVSRKHATVEFKHGECRLEDLGSKNGTIFNGERVDGEILLNDGEEIFIGKHQIRYLARAMIKEKSLDTAMLDRTMVIQSPMYAASAQKAKAKTPVITYEGRRYKVKRSPYSVGTADTVNLPVQGSGIKGIHAILEKDTSEQWWVSHRGGMLSATRVNGKKVNTAPLQSGDLIQAGSAMLRFQLIEEE